MKILLVCPKYRFEGYTPTGLASLGVVAENLGHEVTIADLNVQKLPKKWFDLVGITGMSLWRNSIVAASNLFPSTPVIVGGAWATLRPEYAVSFPNIDYACVGEGEETFKEFLERFPDPHGVKGIVSKANANPPRPYIQNLDALPLPSWHLIALRKYRRVSINTSRGCPYHCCFCAVHQFLGRKWRARSVESVVEEIEFLVKLFRVKHITFGDSNLTLKVDRFQQICEEIIARRIKCEFDVIQGVRADKLDIKLLETMKEAGFTEVIIAPESGSQRVLNEIIHKNLDLSTVEPVVKKCRELGMGIGCFFVIGFPWETMSEIEETLAMAEKLRGLGASCYVGNAIPLIGTDLYHQAKKEGYLRFSDERLEEQIHYLGLPREIHCLTSPYWTPEEIIKITRRQKKLNYRAVYWSYSPAKVASKFLRHPITSFRKALKTI